MKQIALSLCLLAPAAFGAQMTGFISDSSCNVRNANTTAESKECARSCVKAGAEPVFVTTNQKVYKISDKSKVMDLVGEKVVIDGKVTGDTVEVASIHASK